jgi:hypothetical protein
LILYMRCLFGPQRRWEEERPRLWNTQVLDQGTMTVAGRSPMILARNQIALDVSFNPSPRFDHPLIAPPVKYRGSSGGGGGGSGGSLLPLPPPLHRGNSSGSGSSTPRQLHVFDFANLPVEHVSGTSRASMVTPLNLRRRIKVSQAQRPPELQQIQQPGGPSSPSSLPPSPTTPFGLQHGSNLLPFPVPPTTAEPTSRGSPKALRPSTRRLIRSRAMRSPRWQTDAPGSEAPARGQPADLRADGVRVVGSKG